MCLDGSSKGNPDPTGFGGVVRNDCGCFLLGFAGFLGYSEIVQAELTTLLQGLHLCWEKGFRQVVVSSDFVLAIELVQGTVSRFHIYAALVDSNLNQVFTLASVAC